MKQKEQEIAHLVNRTKVHQTSDFMSHFGIRHGQAVDGVQIDSLRSTGSRDKEPAGRRSNFAEDSRDIRAGTCYQRFPKGGVRTSASWTFPAAFSTEITAYM